MREGSPFETSTYLVLAQNSWYLRKSWPNRRPGNLWRVSIHWLRQWIYYLALHSLSTRLILPFGTFLLFLVRFQHTVQPLIAASEHHHVFRGYSTPPRMSIDSVSDNGMTLANRKLTSQMIRDRYLWSLSTAILVLRPVKRVKCVPNARAYLFGPTPFL